MTSQNIGTLEQDLRQYELQLQQVTEAIRKNNESSQDLISLRENIIELISLTNENLNSLKSNLEDDSLAQEYALFKAELGELTPEETNDAEDIIQEELNCLVGSKCQAPYFEHWSDDTFTYHNALIMNVDAEDSLDSVKVKVMFVNPICREMMPCNYFLEGECKFTDEMCYFSHGYMVNFADLKEFREPDFNLIKENVSVLAKDTDDIWKRAIVTSLIPEENRCSVKFESGHKEEVTIDINNTLPLTKNLSDDVKKKKKKIDVKDLNAKSQREMLVEKSLLAEPPNRKLGEWEKHTKSIGSRLMENMGYVVGTGLGKHGDGRLEPVSAVVLPPGKSLDHCMALREAAGGDPNLFKVDKLQKKLRKRALKKSGKKKHASSKVKKPDTDVFSFINNTLSTESSNCTTVASKNSNNIELKQSSSQALNVEELKIGENVEKKKYDLIVLYEKLSRQKANTVGYNAMNKQIKRVQTELNTLNTKLQNVQKEQLYRQTMKELTEF